MKLLVGLLVLISSAAFGYQEKIEVVDGMTRGSWTTADSVSSMGTSPIRGYFNVSTDTFTTGKTCKEFSDKVTALIQDWKKYGAVNMYALTTCAMQNDIPNTVFFYGIDLWRQDGAPAHQQFMKDHQGMIFEGHTLDFSPVVSLVTTSNLMLAKRTGNKLDPIHSGARSQPYQYEDLWYPDYITSANTITQDSKAVFLKYVEDKFGTTEKAAFEKALVTSNYINFGDFFTLTLTNGKTANMWFGFGANKDCGGSACYPSSDLR